MYRLLDIDEASINVIGRNDNRMRRIDRDARNGHHTYADRYGGTNVSRTCDGAGQDERARDCHAT
jgi:hypothetical protein